MYFKFKNEIRIRKRFYLYIGSLRSSDDLKDFVDKLFVEDSNQFQCLCKNCNIQKATQEKLDRKLNK